MRGFRMLVRQILFYVTLADLEIDLFDTTSIILYRSSVFLVILTLYLNKEFSVNATLPPLLS